MSLKLNRIIWLLVLQIMLILPALLMANPQMHTVRKGDTLYSLSKQYGTTVDKLMKLNNLQGNNLSIGQKLVINAEAAPEKPKPVNTAPEKPKPIVTAPVKTPVVEPIKETPPTISVVQPPTPVTIPIGQLSDEYFYTVKAKDNLYRISLEHDIALKDMLAWNGFADSGVPIHPGDKIVIKDPSGAEPDTDERDPEASGISAAKPQVAVSDTVVVERVYVVQKKDTLYRIATSNGMTVDELKKLNGLTSNELRVGQRIYLAGKKRPDGSIKPTPLLTEDDVNKHDKIRTDLIMPVEGKVISEYGLRNGKPHKGVDIGAKQGTPIYAVLDGTVVYSGVQGAYGNVVVIEHPDFVMTVYAHNEKNMVGVDDIVQRGQQIATVGSTGNAQGAHLHFEYRLKGKALNPRKVLPFK
ncbi:MAG: transcriptional regulator [Candidatus Cloacimonetes bacterium HGW-Cloacimonetes-3]|jgi:murein DD-endopeptidase MepM/ murein hydrolase activator NlpD|nr:MAG: transcriptional regulator [Candidatus Cloacimonetes bacterium HGW-Cloacimonetes-3]